MDDQRKLEAITNGLSHFFGFHDLIPWNSTNKLILCHRTGTPEDRIGTYKDVVEICIIDEFERTLEVIGETRAWNWQQGARAQWVPALGPEIAIYNIETEESFGAKIINIKTGDEKQLPYSIFSVAKSGEFALSMNFCRLRSFYRGYGYDHKKSSCDLNNKNDGIFKIDLKTGETKLILSIEEVVSKLPKEARQADHYFTHISINPDDSHFCFLHRYKLKSGGIVTQLIVADEKGKNWKVLSGDKVSHFCWRDSNSILAWARQNPAIKKIKNLRWFFLLKPLYQLSKKIRSNKIRQSLYNECFRLFNIYDGNSTPFGKNVIKEDGHPQVNPVYPNIWVNDTYPDINGYQTLMIYNENKSKRVDILDLKSPNEIIETQWRCDFHPRWDREGMKICLDSAHDSRRQLYVIDVSPIVEGFNQGLQ